MAGTYLLHIYFSIADPLFHVVIKSKLGKMSFNMFSMKTQLNNSMTSVRLHHYDNRHRYE